MLMITNQMHRMPAHSELRDASSLTLPDPLRQS